MNENNHDGITEISNWIQNKLKLLSTWQIVKLVLALGFIAGTLFGLATGMSYEQNRILSSIDQTAHSNLNMFRIDSDVYSITPINVQCKDNLYENKVSCIITNTKNNMTYVMVISK